MLPLATSRLAVWSLLVLVLALGGASAARSQSPVWSGADAGPRVSVLEIPLSIDLRSQFQRADALLPKEAGHWRGWRKQHGIETRYRAWRGPLRMMLSGDLLRVEAHVRYWVQGRKRVLGGFELKAGCGVKEPPRQAIIGLMMRLSWGADWTLRPRFRVLPTRFIDRCEVTAAGIDVSPIIDRVFRRHLEQSLHRALSELGPRLAEYRAEVERYWNALQRPVEIATGLWLEVDPLALALSPPVGRGEVLHTNLALVAVLALTAAAQGEVEPRPLPPLQSFLPRGSGLSFEIDLNLDLALIADHLSGRLAGESLQIEGHRVGIGNVELKGEGSELAVTAALTGANAGRLEIWARPVFDPDTQSLGLEGLDYVYDPQDPDRALMSDLFYQRIRQALQEGANQLLEARIDALRDVLAAALRRSIPRNLNLDVSSLRLAELSLTLKDSALNLRGNATGSLTLRAR